MDMKQAWAEYKEKALKVPLLTAAGLAKASLKKMGASHVGPCPSCGGKDCFSVNHRSDGGWYWNCRREGTGGETSIGLICHAMGVDSDTAKEILTGDPLPTGKTTWSESERRAFDERRETAQRETENEEGDRSQSEDRALLKAQRIWDASDTMKGTPAELYLLNRGHPLREWPDCFRFHPAVEYEHLAKFEEYERDGRTYHRKVKAGPKLPCFVCRVDDVLGDLTGIWRIYITEDGQKARVPDQPGCKIGLGPVRGVPFACLRLTAGKSRWWKVSKPETGCFRFQVCRHGQPYPPVACALSKSLHRSSWFGFTGTAITSSGTRSNNAGCHHPESRQCLRRKRTSWRRACLLLK